MNEKMPHEELFLPFCMNSIYTHVCLKLKPFSDGFLLCLSSEIGKWSAVNFIYSLFDVLQMQMDNFPASILRVHEYLKRILTFFYLFFKIIQKF